MKRSRLAAAAALLSLLVIAPAAGAQAGLTIKVLGSPMNGIELGTQTGDMACTGDGDARTCVTPIGTQGVLRDTVPAQDTSTGANGTMQIVCTIMFSGTTTAFQTTTGTTDATGSQDCDVKFTFSNGDALFGAMHQSRVVAGTTQTSAMAFVFTGGAGQYDGFFGKFSSEEKTAWTPPPPLSEKESTGKRLINARVGDAFDVRQKGKGGSLKVKRSKKALASVASLGKLIPTNRPIVVRAAGAPGSSCTGSITGGTAVELGSAKANAKGIATFKAIAAGAFAGTPSWTAKVTCGGAVASTSLKAYEVLK